jgi:hypothetical protein
MRAGWILKEKVGTTWNGFNCLKRWKNNRISIASKKLLGTIKGWEFVDKLNDYQLYGSFICSYISYQYKAFKCLNRMKIILVIK